MSGIVKSRLREIVKADGRPVSVQAELMGHKRSQLYLWMGGSCSPSVENLKMLSRFYGVSIDWICGMDLEEQCVRDS